MTVDRGLRLKAALPVRWGAPDYSPNTLITGDWQEAAATRQAEEMRNAWRPYRIVGIADETPAIRSFVLEPADGGALVAPLPGQYLTIRTTPDGANKPAVRTYTLSSAPHDPRYRIYVKREPQGQVSAPPPRRTLDRRHC